MLRPLGDRVACRVSGQSLHFRQRRHPGYSRTAMATRELLNVRDTARALGVHENTVRNWEERGLLRAARLPGSGFRRFAAEDVERLRDEMLDQLAARHRGPDLEPRPQAQRPARPRRRPLVAGGHRRRSAFGHPGLGIPLMQVMAISLALTDAHPASELGQLLVGDSAEPVTESVEWYELALVAQALMHFLESQEVPVGLREYFRLVDAPAAHAIIDQLLDAHVDPRSVDRVAALMAGVDLLGDAYTASLPTGSRHRLGEYYTPAWLAQRIVERYAPDQGVVLDPACGDARFLVTLIRAGRAPTELYGVELNPVAAALARAATWIAEGRPAEPAATIVWGDFLLGGSSGLRIQSTDPLSDGLVEFVDQLPSAHWIVGNPPWVTWRNISSGSRARLVERFKDTSLNGLRGWHARVAAGQTDLSHLFIHEAAERVARGGRITFVLPRTIFTAPSSPMAIRSGKNSVLGDRSGSLGSRTTLRPTPSTKFASRPLLVRSRLMRCPASRSSGVALLETDRRNQPTWSPRLILRIRPLHG